MCDGMSCVIDKDNMIALQKLVCYIVLKHTTTLFALFSHYILSQEWRVIVGQVQTNYHGIVSLWCYNQSGVTELLIMRDPHYCLMWLSQLKLLELYILSCGKGLGFRPRPFPQLRI